MFIIYTHLPSPKSFHQRARKTCFFHWPEKAPHQPSEEKHRLKTNRKINALSFLCSKLVGCFFHVFWLLRAFCQKSSQVSWNTQNCGMSWNASNGGTLGPRTSDHASAQAALHPTFDPLAIQRQNPDLSYITCVACMADSPWNNSMRLPSFALTRKNFDLHVSRQLS